MSEFLYHAPCPNCGSRDNLGVYTDHQYCFGCNYSNFENSVNPKLLKVSENNKKKIHGNCLPMPDDASPNIPAEGIKWLQQYHITGQDMNKHNILWSETGRVVRGIVLFAPCMIFPVYDCYGNLLMWQGRYFGDDKKAPKYFTAHAKDVLHVIGTQGSVVLVEDFISAIRVGKKHARSLPLWGSSINLDLLVRLYHVCDDITIWLDADKGRYAEEAANRARQFFNHVKVIHTDLDPKCYSDSEIERILGCQNSA